jgi:hypothetical protein
VGEPLELWSFWEIRALGAVKLKVGGVGGVGFRQTYSVVHVVFVIIFIEFYH